MTNIKKEWSIKASLPVEFSVKITKDLLDLKNASLLEHGTTHPGARRLILVDSCVFYGREEKIKAYFDHHEILTKIVSIDKSLLKMSHFLCRNPCEFGK